MGSIVHAQQLRHEPSESGRLGPAAAAIFPDPVASEGAQRFDDRAKRQAVITERDRPSLKDEPATFSEPARYLGDETALADSGLATDEHERRLSHAAASAADRRACNSSERPMKTGLDRRRAMRWMIGLVGYAERPCRISRK